MDSSPRPSIRSPFGDSAAPSVHQPESGRQSPENGKLPLPTPTSPSGRGPFRFFPSRKDVGTSGGASGITTGVSSINGDAVENRTIRSGKHRFKSYRLVDKYEQPWITDKRLKRGVYSNIIVWTFIIIALGISGYLNFAAAKRANRGPYCLILDDHFETLDPNVWSHEVQTGGFGTGSFDWTTTDQRNSFVDKDGLHIVPTLTSETTSITSEQMLDGYTLNLTRSGGDGTCTSDRYMDCSVRSNLTQGSIVPPVRSARLSTKGKKTIKYGRVEVVAKLPKGDWLWPAIWMMPENPIYGEWPASGEIDIMEAKGNDIDYDQGGRDLIHSTIHWGPTTGSDAYRMSSHSKRLKRSDFSRKFHTFGFEWSENYLFMYIDNKLAQTLYWNFKGKKTMWERGYFSSQTENSSLLVDPWSKTGRQNTPFDQPFFLILNVAVGGTNGWFPDGKGGKPWIDRSDNAASDFYKDKDSWLPTWGKGNDRGMTIKSVKMWQQGNCA